MKDENAPNDGANPEDDMIEDDFDLDFNKLKKKKKSKKKDLDEIMAEVDEKTEDKENGKLCKVYCVPKKNCVETLKIMFIFLKNMLQFGGKNSSAR